MSERAVYLTSYGHLFLEAIYLLPQFQGLAQFLFFSCMKWRNFSTTSNKNTPKTNYVIQHKYEGG